LASNFFVLRFVVPDDILPRELLMANSALQQRLIAMDIDMLFLIGDLVEGEVAALDWAVVWPLTCMDP
jgi:hypothetical protein